jgi:hypothetical protein
MELSKIPTAIKISGFLILFFCVMFFASFSISNIDNIEFQIKWFEYFWNLSLYSCIMIIVITTTMDKSRKTLLILMIILTTLLCYFLIPALNHQNISMTNLTLYMLMYNILFLSILYAISKLNFNCLFIILLNVIIVIGLMSTIFMINYYLIFSHSTTITYIIALLFIGYIILTMKMELFKMHNVYMIFLMLGNFITILLYFTILFLSINNIIMLSGGLIIFINSFQPLFYWIGINFILMEED